MVVAALVVGGYSSRSHEGANGLHNLLFPRDEWECKLDDGTTIHTNDELDGDSIESVTGTVFQASLVASCLQIAG
jgi:hypothetical protein